MKTEPSAHTNALLKALKWTAEPLLLFAAVFIASHIWQKFTLSNQESLGLFLWAPDYLSEVFASERPISRLIGGFLVQFYRYQFLGELVTAAIVTGIFFLLRWFSARCGLHCGAICTLAACIAWLAIANAPDPSLGVFILLIVCISALAGLLLRIKEFFRLRFGISIAISAILIGGSCFSIAKNEKIQAAERWSLIEQAAVNHNWDYVLSAATPSQCSRDREMIPFALLALNEKGQLAEKMFQYPIQGPEDMDTEGRSSRRAFLFSSILYESLGCGNEAIHQTFQSACFTRHGTNFGALRQLTRFFASQGNEAMVQKYCSILGRSSLHKAFTEKYLTIAKERSREKTAVNDSWVRNIMNHDQQADLILLQKEGISSAITMDRYFCYFLAKKDINNFKTQFELAKDYYTTVPRHFREALEIADGNTSPDNIYFQKYYICQQ